MVKFAPPLLLALVLAAAALSLIPLALMAPTKGVGGVVLLVLFSGAALYLGGRELPSLARRGPAISVNGGLLTVFTGRVLVLPLDEIRRAESSAGWDSRVILHDSFGRSVTVRSDLTNRSSKSIAAALNRLIEEPEAPRQTL